MKSLILTVALVPFMSPGVLAAVVREAGSSSTAARNIIPRSSGANEYAFGNLSSLFGWQLAGAGASDSETATAGYSKWAAMGLSTDDIQEAIWTASNTSPSPTDSISPIITYTTNILITQLQSSFSNSDEAFTYLCNNTRFDLLDDFLLNDTAVIGSMCGSVGRQTPPRPFGPAGGDNPDAAAAHAAQNSASILFAFILAAGATTNSELNVLCAHAPMYVGNLNAMLMNGTAFQETLCAIHEPISVGEAVDGIVTWLTRIFITMLENMTNVGQYVEWLCENVDVECMDEAGLDGVVVQQSVCNESLGK